MINLSLARIEPVPSTQQAFVHIETKPPRGVDLLFSHPFRTAFRKIHKSLKIFKEAVP
jgi:hypothetical protein